MKKIFIYFHFFCCFRDPLQAQNVNIPDVNFKAYLVVKTDSINTNKDTEISVAEAIAFKVGKIIPTKGIS